MMKVTARMDRMGNVTVAPVSQRRHHAYLRHLAQFGIHAATVYVQFNVDEFIAQDIPARHRTDLMNGWDVTFHVDPWVFGHWLGWDCHEVG